MASVTQRFLFPVSTVSARNAWDHDVHKYIHAFFTVFCVINTKKKKRLKDYESRCLRKRDTNERCGGALRDIKKKTTARETTMN